MNHVMRFAPIILFLTFPLSAYGQDYPSSNGVYGYTSINFDPSTNVVTAYSESDVDPDILGYYNVNVSMSLQDQNHNTLANPSGSSTGTFVSVTAMTQGSSSTTYTAIGLHYINMTQQQYVCQGDTCGMEWLDYQYETVFEPMGIDEPGIFDFTGPGPSTPTPNGPDIPLGQTYDNASLTTPPACGDVRDQMITEYRTNNTPFLPICSDFTQSSPDSHWTFPQLNSGTYSWAVIGSYFTTGLVAVQNSAGNLTINGAYRNPEAEKTAASNAGAHYPPGSRHQYGDAADLATGNNQNTFTAIRSAGLNNSACGEPQSVSGLGHVHLDWRQQAPLKWKVQCSSTWLQ